MPLTDFQRGVLALLARNRTPESYLAGGAALHFLPNSTRYSQDLDFYWAHDSAWPFLPPVRDLLGGFLLHEVDLATNKVLALAGRDEPRDFVDILFIHERILPLAALVWGAVGKDPGFTPLSLLELLRRRGRPRPEEVARLHLAVEFDLVAGKAVWLEALDEADAFARSRPAGEAGCLYYALPLERFVLPRSDATLESQGVRLHFGRPGGVLPRAADP